MTRSQVERLGGRLVSSSPPAHKDLDALHELLVVYADALADAVARVHERLGIVPTSRVKNTGTSLEKLERFGGSWLKSIEDLAGMRIVRGFDREGQDRLVEQLVDLFDSDDRPPKMVDRREHPVQGYTAVHVIVFIDGLPVEIQVRPRLQHEWADLFEKLADRVGRGIRYGEPPAHWLTGQERDRQAIGMQIRLYELSVQQLPREEVDARKARVDGNLAVLRRQIEELDRTRASIQPLLSN